jgi:SAM-dependent methyltransferase
MSADVVMFVCAKAARFAHHIDRRFSAFVEPASNVREHDRDDGVFEVRTRVRHDASQWFVGGGGDPVPVCDAVPTVSTSPVLLDEKTCADQSLFRMLDALHCDALVLRYVQRMVIVRDSAALTLREVVDVLERTLVKPDVRLRIVTDSREQDRVVGSAIQSAGFTMAPQNATHVIFAAASGDDRFRMSICPARWAAGIYAHKHVNIKETICSASKKIAEALSITGVDPSGLRILDVGAAPGGWTFECASRGAAVVVAVDPGAMHADVLRLPNVVNLRGLAESQAAQIREHAPFDCLVCDASVVFAHEGEKLSDVLASLARDVLKPGALIILTLKLPRRSKNSDAQARRVDRIVAALAPKFGVGVEKYQLVHLLANTEHERTLVMRI